MNIRKKIIITLIFLISLLLTGSVISLGVDNNYITTENGQGSIRKSSDGKYTQTSTKTADTIFEELKNDVSRAKYFQRVSDTNTSNRIQVSYTRSMKETEMVYCVNRGGHIDSSYRWLYYIKGYIEIKGGTVTVYKSNGIGGYTTYTKENVNFAEVLAAAVSVNNPLSVANGGTAANVLGYGNGSKDSNGKIQYNSIQQLVYYYWNQSSFLDEIGCSEWRHTGGDYSDLKDLEKASQYLENFMKNNTDMTYEAQIIYLDADDPETPTDNKIYQWNDRTNEKQAVKDSSGHYVKNAQQLIMAVGEGKEEEKEKVEFQIEKTWNLNGASESEVIYPDEVYFSIYKKSEDGTDATLVKTVTLKQSLSDDKKKYIYNSDTITLDGSIDDYEIKENKISEWQMENMTFQEDKSESNDSEESKVKKGTLIVKNKYVPIGELKKDVIRISGKVFLDKDANKAGVTSNGICDSTDKGIAGIEVTWRRSDGIIIASTQTAADGTYTMETSARLWLKGYDSEYNGGDNALNQIVNTMTGTGLYYFDYNKFKQFDDSYVEFRYNGVEYTTSTVPSNSSTIAESSKATTSDINRLILDSKFNEITYDGVSSSNLINGILNIITDKNGNVLQLGTIQNFIDNLSESELASITKAIGNTGSNDVLNQVLKNYGINGDAQKELDQLNNNKNNGNYYKQFIAELQLGGFMEQVLNALGTAGDTIGLDKVLDVMNQYFKIGSQEAGSVNKLLDIFNLKDKIDTLNYILGNPQTYNIQYTDGDNSKVVQKVAQTTANYLNKFKTTASTKGTISNMLTGYKYSKSYKHTEYTKYCNPFDDVEKEYNGNISNKYSNNKDLSITFKDDITEDEHGLHTAANSIIDSEILDYMDEFLKDIKLAPDETVSSGTYYSFIKEALVNTMLNSHLGILNCNGFQMQEGIQSQEFETAKEAVVAALGLIPGGEIVAPIAQKILQYIHLYEVNYKVDTTVFPKFGHAYAPSQRTDSWDITNVNCGLILREQPDAMIESDIAQVRVIMKGQEYTYNYKLRSDAYNILDAVNAINIGAHTFNLPTSTQEGIGLDSTSMDTLKVVMESLQGQYTRKLNPANITYLSEGDSSGGNDGTNNRTNEYQIYITYYIRVANQSNTLPMRINKIVNYYEGDCYEYNGEYTFVTEDENGERKEYKNSDYWKESTADDSGVATTGNYKCVVSEYDKDNNIWILPGTKTALRPLTYKVKLTEDNLGTLKQNKKLLVSNVSEIASYTTGYGLNTICVNGETTLKHPLMFLSGYAGVDKDSQPGNAIISLANTITDLLAQNGLDIKQSISDNLNSLGEALSNQGNSNANIPTTEYIASLLNIDGLPDKVKNELNKLFATGIEGLLNNISKMITDGTGINIYNLLQKMEDDTSMAPLFKLDLTENYRIIQGKVFEDQQVNDRPRERIGNGKYDSTEKGVAGVRVELHKVSEDGTHQIATLYGIDKDGKSIVKEAVTYTNENGDYSFGEIYDSSKGQGYGVIEDKYQIYYIYGDSTYKVEEYTIDKNGKNEQTINEGEKSINSTIDNNTIDARNYKSTIITDSTIKDVFQNANSQNNKNWHIVTNNNSASVAIDDINQRKAINAVDLTLDTYNNKYNIVSYTNTFEQGVEYRLDEGTQVNKSGEPSEDKITTSKKFDTNIALNFGIIERPREDIIVDKTISNIKLVLANGQVLFDGNPYTDRLPYLIAVGTKDIRTGYDRSDRLVRIEMDTELMQGAELQITYQITITNKSEIDYTTENYYYYGEKGNDNELVNGCVPLLVDYLDSDCEFVEDNADNIKYNWKVMTADELTEKKLIETAVNEAAKAGKYTILTTDYFSEVPINGQTSITLYATKLLSTKSDEYTFENHVEILQINGNRARTIKEMTTDNNTRVQVDKEYRPGNYIPSTKARVVYTNEHLPLDGMHEQDDDRITIKITPPTGSITREGYIMIAIISLITIGIGAYIIKKKVLTK